MQKRTKNLLIVGGIALAAGFAAVGGQQLLNYMANYFNTSPGVIPNFSSGQATLPNGSSIPIPCSSGNVQGCEMLTNQFELSQLGLKPLSPQQGEKLFCQNATDRINYNFTKKNELGPFPLTYVDVPCNFTKMTCGECHSGVTVSAGVDLKSKTIQTLNSWGINAEHHSALYKKLIPYLGKKSCNAHEFLIHQPLNVTRSEANYLDLKAIKAYTSGVVSDFGAIGVNFYKLPAGVQTAFFDYYYWHGNTDAINGYVESEDWTGLAKELYMLAMSYPPKSDFRGRYLSEYHKITYDISNGSLEDYDLCHPKKN
jgi:hypothetical protein